MQPATLPEMLLIEDRTRTCLIDGRKTLTYGELDSQSSDVAALLESLGVRKGLCRALLNILGFL